MSSRIPDRCCPYSFIDSAIRFLHACKSHRAGTDMRPNHRRDIHREQLLLGQKRGGLLRHAAACSAAWVWTRATCSKGARSSSKLISREVAPLRRAHPLGGRGPGVHFEQRLDLQQPAQAGDNPVHPPAPAQVFQRVKCGEDMGPLDLVVQGLEDFGHRRARPRRPWPRSRPGNPSPGLTVPNPAPSP